MSRGWRTSMPGEEYCSSFANSRISRPKTHLFAPGSSVLATPASICPRIRLIFRCQIIFKTESSFKVEKIPLWKTSGGQAQTVGFTCDQCPPVRHRTRGARSGRQRGYGSGPPAGKGQQGTHVTLWIAAWLPSTARRLEARGDRGSWPGPSK